MTLIKQLLKKLNDFEKHNLFYFDDKYFSCNQILKYKNIAKDKLIELKVEPQTTIMVKGDINPTTISLFIACIELNLVVVPTLDTNKNIIEDRIRISNVQIIIEAYFNDNYELVFDYKKVENTNKKIKLYQNLKNKNVPGLVLFTSGTSGEPKAALHNVDLLFKSFLKNGKTLKTIGFLLFDHWGGLNTVFYSLFNGGCIVCLKHRDPEYICKMIEKTEAQLLPTSPTFINLLLASKYFKIYDLSSLKIISYGSEPMPEFTLHELKKTFPNIKLKQTYGLIEIGVLKTQSNKTDSLFLKIDTKDIKYRLRDEMLEIKTPTAMIGYLNSEQPFTKDGWFITGDKVEVINDEIRIIGRKSEIINIGGEKVYPLEVETVLLKHPKVIDALIYGEKNFLLGSIVCAKVFCNDVIEKTFLENEIKRFCYQYLKPYQVPVKIKFLDKPLQGDRLKKVRKIV